MFIIIGLEVCSFFLTKEYQIKKKKIKGVREN